MVETRNKNSKLTENRTESPKRIAEYVKRSSKSATTPSDIVTVGQRAFTNKRQRPENNLQIVDHRSSNRAKIIVSLPMQHSRSEAQNPELSRDANNGHFDFDPNNQVFDLIANKYYHHS